MITGIVVALPEELTTLTAIKIDKGRVAQLGDKILVIYSGAGAENARKASELLLKSGAERLISWGCAAALDVSIGPGDLVLASSCVDADQVVFVLNNQDWMVQVKDCLSKRLTAPTYTGKLAESKSIVSSSHDKAQIADATGALAVDMESVAIAKVALAHNLPFLSIRAVADPLDMNMPKAIAHALNNEGDVALTKLLIYLLCHPAQLPGLVKLGLYFHSAKKTLKQVALELDCITRFNPQKAAIP